MTRKPLRILEITPWSVHGSGTGGMAAVVRDLTADLRRGGHSVDLLAKAWHAPKPQRDSQELRLRLPELPPHGALSAKAKWRLHHERAARCLRDLARDRKIDILHAHYASPYLSVLERARRLGGPPYVVTCHGGDVRMAANEPRTRQQAIRRGLANAAACVTVSRALAEDVATVLGREDCVTIPNGIDVASSTLLKPKEIEAQLDRTLPTAYAIMVANMRPCKGHDVALKAWARLKARGTNLPLCLVGSGPAFDATRARAVELGLGDDDVLFLGHQPRTVAQSLIRDARLLVAPSRSEGHSITLLEAGALETPVICSDIDAFTHMIKDGETGHIFLVDDDQSLARKTADALADPARSQDCARKLHDDVQAMFSVSAMRMMYERTFYEAIGFEALTSA